MADDEIDINLRPVREVAKRLVVLASVQRRGFLEDASAEESLGEEIDDERFDLMAWLDQEGVSDVLEPFERAFLTTEVGSLDDFDAEVIYDETQRSVALAWYLRLIPAIPPYDEPELPSGYLDLIPAPWDSVSAWSGGLQSCKIEDLARERELAEIWYWRINIEFERRSATAKDRAQLERAIQEAATEAANAGLIPELANGDLPLAHGQVNQASTETLETVEILAEQRLHALNWLSGYGESWSNVPLDL